LHELLIYHCRKFEDIEQICLIIALTFSLKCIWLYENHLAAFYNCLLYKFISLVTVQYFSKPKNRTSHRIRIEQNFFHRLKPLFSHYTFIYLFAFFFQDKRSHRNFFLFGKSSVSLL